MSFALLHEDQEAAFEPASSSPNTQSTADSTAATPVPVSRSARVSVDVEVDRSAGHRKKAFRQQNVHRIRGHELVVHFFSLSMGSLD